MVVALGLIGLSRYTAVEPITSCDPVGTAHPICGWQNPEDMVVLPNGRFVIASEYGGLNGEKNGTLALLELETEHRHVLYSGGALESTGTWGESTCLETAPDKFSPHGIHLSQRSDGSYQLLAVQHGGRDSVEQFEVTRSEDSWILEWRGCVEMPEGRMINDVVATPEGGFLVTHMMPRSETALGMLAEFLKESLLGIETGVVLSWHPDEGFDQLNSSIGIVPNGIEISADGETVFVNYSGNGEIRRINRMLDTIEASNSDLPPLDNVTWTPDGRLLVAGGLENSVKMMGCTNLETGTCPGAYAIVGIDPETFESEIVYEGGPNTAGGAGTVGLQLGDGSLLIGTFAGDRIVRVMPVQFEN